LFDLVIEELEHRAYKEAAANDEEAAELLRAEEETRRLDTVKIGIDLGPIIEAGEKAHEKHDAAAAQDVMNNQDKGDADGSSDGDLEKKIVHNTGTVVTEHGAVASVTHMYTDATAAQTARTMSAFGELFELLLTKYHDGAIATQRDTPNLVMVKMFYPQWWLNATGYYNNKPNFGPGVLMFDTPPGFSSSSMSMVGLVAWTLAVLVTGMYVGKKFYASQPSNREYVQIGTEIEMI